MRNRLDSKLILSHPLSLKWDQMGMAKCDVDLVPSASGVVWGECEFYIFTYAFVYAAVLWLFSDQSGFLNFSLVVLSL